MGQRNDIEWQEENGLCDHCAEKFREQSPEWIRDVGPPLGWSYDDPPFVWKHRCHLRQGDAWGREVQGRLIFRQTN